MNNSKNSTTKRFFKNYISSGSIAFTLVTFTIGLALMIGFAQAATTYTLTVSKIGSGNVISNTMSINCGTSCSQVYNANTSVVLTASPSSGYSFAGWSGNCTGTGSCSVTMNSNKSVTANFSVVTTPSPTPSPTPSTTYYTLTANKIGSGTINATGISCGSDCSEVFTSGTGVSLAASPSSGYTFSGWSGNCTGMGFCNVTMNSNKSVTANFSAITAVSYMLTVSKSGSGTITSNLSGISCDNDCSESYPDGTYVLLTASANSGYYFSSWSGCFSYSGNTCTVYMNGNQSVTANFIYSNSSSNYYYVSVSKSGSGYVNSNISGIDCGSDCAESYTNGTYVTLTASPASGYYFSGWSGACSGSGVCSLYVNSDKIATATFTYSSGSPTQYGLTVLKYGSGSVMSSPSGINCDSDCLEYFDNGSYIILTAMPSSGASFSYWLGCDSFTSSVCRVTMNSTRSVSAYFTSANPSPQPQKTYNISISKTGLGAITSSPSGINCGSTCSVNFIVNTSLTLTATPASGYAFSYWSGCDSVNGNKCKALLNTERSISAVFAKKLISVPPTPPSNITSDENDQPPSGPTGLREYSTGGSTADTVSLFWSDNSDNELTFEVLVWDDATKEWTLYNVLPANSTSATVVKGDTPKTWGVRACNDAGCSEKSTITLGVGSAFLSASTLGATKTSKSLSAWLTDNFAILLWILILAFVITLLFMIYYLILYKREAQVIVK